MRGTHERSRSMVIMGGATREHPQPSATMGGPNKSGHDGQGYGVAG
jgi:hypothetical protein